MFCRYCGNQVEPTDVVCVKCARQLREPVRPHVPNYLIWSVLAMLFCCPPFGIVAIVFSAMVNSKLARGDVAGAQRASRMAMIWCWVTFAVGILFQILSMWWGINIIIKTLQSHGAYV